ncbi:hypothetical protein BDV28DRAFT_15544 [Aspergillus coremiiformis]|uniref:Uncharacterized protein n=1 Tax=Aspergillus coremiiformis TaxID=138285 RepID=A0A5N6Z205_9EURO|nr:hypothetical protein BDV28DRAFT_15544 [Aspergillus coremiiformis]
MQRRVMTLSSFFFLIFCFAFTNFIFSIALHPFMQYAQLHPQFYIFSFFFFLFFCFFILAVDSWLAITSQEDGEFSGWIWIAGFYQANCSSGDVLYLCDLKRTACLQHCIVHYYIF